MKKIFYSFMAILSIFGATSCSDMLETDSPAMVIDPELNQKTDSVFYAFGVAQAMQQLADQYFFIGEMRGDLVSTTYHTDTNLRELADYSATTTNRYDSAYVYYRVINNCNYYLAHRDTTLLTGATNVTIDEYAAIEAYRAWAYMQLGRTYEKVPFFTDPLTTISQIEESNYPSLTLDEIIDQLTPSLEKFTGRPVPTLGYAANGSYSIGSTNWGQAKNINPRRVFIPVDVILGEMYLERGEYLKAAQHYCTYLADNNLTAEGYGSFGLRKWQQLPDDLDTEVNVFQTDWNTIFRTNPNPADVITYIPMAVSSIRGTTTNVPLAFGYDYYSTDRENNCPRVEEIQIVPSSEYFNMVDSAEFYYFTGAAQAGVYPVGCSKLGDFRGNTGKNTYGDRTNNNILNMSAEDTTKVWIAKAITGNIILYRTSTIYLHLAEALNRLGHPDLAFAILRNGISDYLEQLIDIEDENGERKSYKYITPESYALLQNEVPFLSEANIAKFSNNDYEIYGIHYHGCSSMLMSNASSTLKGSRRSAIGHQGDTLYLPKPVIGKKMQEIAAQYGVAVGETLQDSINAMEDLLCDEYAMEFAFEGTRFYDLVRLARNKNRAATYGGNFGDIWLSEKLKNKREGITTKNCYLPF